METATTNGMNKNGTHGLNSNKRKLTRERLKNSVMSHGALNTGILRTSSLGRFGSMLKTGKVMTGLTLIGLI